MKVLGQPFDHLGSPPFFLLPRENLLSDAPIEKNELTIDG